ncbi:hypothetical protein [Bacillus sp. 0909A]|uniref:hypothetical protein n=1 Tax=Bacillus sp. 0909A TaxID=3120561 RepID=UPI002FDAD63B
MGTEIVAGHPDRPDAGASQLMAEHQIRRLPILENEGLTGIALGNPSVKKYTDQKA